MTGPVTAAYEGILVIRRSIISSYMISVLTSDRINTFTESELSVIECTEITYFKLEETPRLSYLVDAERYATAEVGIARSRVLRYQSASPHRAKFELLLIELVTAL